MYTAATGTAGPASPSGHLIQMPAAAPRDTNMAATNRWLPTGESQQILLPP